MTGNGLTELPVRNLEHLFTPPGLPLISKSEGAPATTSILIRGGAGTGKTTLGAALGQAMARRENGVVLYLTTEFSQTELLYKAKLLGLSEDMVFRWKDRTAAPPGAIVTEHLALTSAGHGPLTSLERKAGSIEALWDLLHPESGPLDVTVRAVVIDAFTLPDASVEEKTLRSDLVAFVQALEGEGISTVIVEEATDERSSWLPFVVDLVFEIAWVADPDSADLHRKLRCSKSRYAQALAGPHDYGLDMGVPAVWPDLLAVASVLGVRDLAVQRPAALFFQYSSVTSGTSNYIRFVRGGVALFERSRYASELLTMISWAPGVVVAEVRCGPMNMIRSDALPAVVQVPDSEGAQSLGWALVRAAREQGVNVVVLHDPEALLRRQRFSISLLHVVETLRLLGILVIIHAKQEHLEALTSIADITTNGSTGVAQEPLAFPASRMRWSGIWVADLPGVDRSLVMSADGRLDQASPYFQLRCGQEQISAQDIVGARDTLMSMPARDTGTMAGRVLIASGWMLHKLGMTGIGIDRMLTGTRYSNGFLSEDALWARALVNPNEAIFFDLKVLLSARPVSPGLALLWSSLCAVHARSEAAIEVLKEHVEGAKGKLIIGFLLRALALRGQSLDVRSAADRFGEQHRQPTWLTTRMAAEAMLEDPRKNERGEAFEVLANLQVDAAVPLLHRADIAHNLGAILEDERHFHDAASRYRAALVLNPFLESTREGLTRLGLPVPPLP